MRSRVRKQRTPQPERIGTSWPRTGQGRPSEQAREKGMRETQRLIDGSARGTDWRQSANDAIAAYGRRPTQRFIAAEHIGRTIRGHRSTNAYTSRAHTPGLRNPDRARGPRRDDERALGSADHDERRRGVETAVLQGTTRRSAGCHCTEPDEDQEHRRGNLRNVSVFRAAWSRRHCKGGAVSPGRGKGSCRPGRHRFPLHRGHGG